MPIEVFKAGSEPLTSICESHWGKNVCPNRAESILIVIGNAGFAVMCGPHRDGYLEQYGNEGVEVHPYSHDLAMNLLRDAVDKGL